MLMVQASANSTTMALQKAILVYGVAKRNLYDPDQSLAITHATINDVEMKSGAPVLKAGRLMTQSDLNELVTGLSQSQSLSVPSWIDTTMLALGAGRMIWYTPACQRAMFFKTSSFTKDTFEAQGQLPTPGLVWLVMQGALYVYAYKGSGRPDKETKLYQAPFFNVWSQGKVCTGNAAMPVGDNAAIPHMWVDAFFGSNFTHPNFKEKDRLVKGVCPIDFWKAMTEKPLPVFPEGRLVDLPLTVADLLAPDLNQKLGNIDRAAGEF
ncbi:PRTRC system protein B [Polaromonas naphthalenivorans]|uniref:PRTRC system protein B n=1 Tax=Polaromonas naphthalenivorans (strain CJ2) TaxID=365044 RepID=A1VVA0_POLNA|nr:PRTRC system protein B [Polaromonas naphthalenivorans]ABM39578.1 conserved hypothetical protein [Polaromonas naphthalenivorans CJ2]